MMRQQQWLATTHRKSGTPLVVGGVLAAVLLIGGLSAYSYAQRDIPEQHADVIEHFKYGSIGAEARAGIPYWIWLVLPRVFPQYLPDRPGDGYARMGFVYETPGAARPIGTSYRERPIGLVGLNCATCHVGTVKDSPQGPARIVSACPRISLISKRTSGSCSRAAAILVSTPIHSYPRSRPQTRGSPGSMSSSIVSWSFRRHVTVS